MAKKKKSDYMKQADRAFSKYVRTRDGGCQAADKDGRECLGVLQCCHIIGRGQLEIRTHPDNAIAMCKSHHMYYTPRPGAWYGFIETNYPGRHDVLWRLCQEHRRLNRPVDWKQEAAKWKAAV